MRAIIRARAGDEQGRKALAEMRKRHPDYEWSLSEEQAENSPKMLSLEHGKDGASPGFWESQIAGLDIEIQRLFAPALAE